MTTHVIVGCGKAKADTATAARDLYISGYSKSKWAYADAVGDDQFVYSAEHGIVHADTVLEPYDTRASNVPDDVLRDRVASTVDRIPDDADRVIVLAGKDYIVPTRDVFEDKVDADVEFPFQEVADLGGMGDQAEWCKVEATKAKNTGVDDYV